MLRKIFLRLLIKLDVLRIIRFSDEIYLKIYYNYKLGKKLNLDNPRTFDEKLQWLKLYDRNPKYTKMVDKFEVKKYISSLIGEEYIIPTIAVYNNFDEINFDELPNKFVMKCTHDSGGNVICQDKSKLNMKAVRKKINKSLKKNYFYIGREWPYKDVKPRIIIEKYMENRSTNGLNDYKVHCFNGKPEFTLVCSDRYFKEITKYTYFDNNWKVMELTEGGHPIDATIKKPDNLEKMLEFSKLIVKDIPHARVDWYEINGKLYFGEVTFFTNSGFEKFEPDEWNYKLGEMIDLKLVKNVNNSMK